MKNRDIKIISTIVAAIVVTVVLCLLNPRCGKSITVVAPIGDSAFYWHTKYDKEVASQKGLKEQFDLKNLAVADSLAKLYKTKEKWLNEYLIAWTSGNTNLTPIDSTLIIGTVGNTGNDFVGVWDTNYLKPVVPCPPQIRSLSQSFKNPYYDLQVELNIGSKSHAILQRHDTLTSIWKDVKEGGLFNRKKFLQNDLSFADTSNHVVGMMSYRKAVPKPKKIAIGFQFGYRFTGFNIKSMQVQGKVYGGVGATYTLFRL